MPNQDERRGCFFSTLQLKRESSPRDRELSRRGLSWQTAHRGPEHRSSALVTYFGGQGGACPQASAKAICTASRAGS